MDNTNKSKLRDIVVQDVIETCAVKGLMIKTTAQSDDVAYNHAPLSLFPTPYPLHLYQSALKLQQPLGVMVADLVRQPDQMHNILRFFQEQDLLMKKLIDISKAYNKQSLKQDVHVCILRSDYMIDKDTNAVKLVEYNTIASSFGCLCQKVREVQHYIREKYGDEIKYNHQPSTEDDQLGKTYIKDIGSVFQRTIAQYQKSMQQKFPDHSTEQKDIWVLFVIDVDERNICDQKLIEYEIFEQYGIKSLRLTFTQVSQLAEVDNPTNALRIHGHEIGFVYYRTGYQLEQYTSEADWKAREILECAMPIKCPSIDVHLVTFKKFQQAFGDEVLLQKIMTGHLHESEIIKHLFKGIWTLEDIDTGDAILNQIIEKAKENPHNYVIKPQKEGGGHNFYDDDVRKLLQTETTENLKQYLIMERINPPEIKAIMLRNGKVIEGMTLSELGIYSSVFIDTQQDQPIENQTFGRLLRTKAKESNEGGVNAGFAVVDTPLIIEIEDLTKEIQPTVNEF